MPEGFLVLAFLQGSASIAQTGRLLTLRGLGRPGQTEAKEGKEREEGSHGEGTKLPPPRK
jgi:hypothetical protein